MMGGSHTWVFGVVLMTASVASWAATATADPGPDDPAAARLDPDYAAGRHAIDTRDWGIALTRLSAAALRDTSNADIQNRSEERRVGKEGRTRWSPYHEKKKNNTL